MKNTLRTMAWTAIGAAVLLVAGASRAIAEEKLIANVPFEFIVGQSKLPAGHYVVTEADDPALVSIANAEGRGFTFVLTVGSSLDENVDQPELVFKQYGGRYFLSQIVTTGTEVREIPLAPATMAEKVDRIAAVLYR